MTLSSTDFPLPADVDPRLWFHMPGCEGRHYLVDGNSHTFHGRMYFYCPPQSIYTRISKSEIGECSDETRYFIRGFLSGNEPSPPRDNENDLLDNDDPQFVQWRTAVEVMASSRLTKNSIPAFRIAPRPFTWHVQSNLKPLFELLEELNAAQQPEARLYENAVARTYVTLRYLLAVSVKLRKSAAFKLITSDLVEDFVSRRKPPLYWYPGERD